MSEPEPRLHPLILQERRYQSAEKLANGKVE